jgi:hypothetical protein
MSNDAFKQMAEALQRSMAIPREPDIKVVGIEGVIEYDTPLTLKDNVLQPAQIGDVVIGRALSPKDADGAVRVAMCRVAPGMPEKLVRMIPPLVQAADATDAYMMKRAKEAFYQQNLAAGLLAARLEGNAQLAKWRPPAWGKTPPPLVDAKAPDWGKTAPPMQDQPSDRPLSTKIAWSIAALREKQTNGQWSQRTADIFAVIERVMSRQMGDPITITICEGTINFAQPSQISVKLTTPVPCTLGITETPTPEGVTYDAQIYSARGISSATSRMADMIRDQYSSSRATAGMRELTKAMAADMGIDLEQPGLPMKRTRKEPIPQSTKTQELEVNERDITL